MARGQNSLTISAKSSIIDVRLGSKCTSECHQNHDYHPSSELRTFIRGKSGRTSIPTCFLGTKYVIFFVSDHFDNLTGSIIMQ